MLSIKLIVIVQFYLYNRFTCNAAVWIWSSSSKLKGKIYQSCQSCHEKKVIRFGNDKMNSQCKCWSVKLILILSYMSYMKHKYFFPRPNHLGGGDSGIGLLVIVSYFRRGLNPPHRVKSISMTSFTPEEMEFLKSRGNDVCYKLIVACKHMQRFSFSLFHHVLSHNCSIMHFRTTLEWNMERLEVLVVMMR